MAVRTEPMDHAGTPAGRVRRKFSAEVRPRTEEQRIRAFVLAAVIGLAGAAGFTILLVDVLQRDGAALLDPSIQRAVEALRAPAPTAVFIVLAVLFGPIGMPVIVAVTVGIWFARARHAWRPLLLAAAMVTGVVLAEVITHLVGRPRPPLGRMLFGADHTASFPSGHLLGIANFCLVGGYLVASRSRRVATRIAVPAVAVVLIAAMAVDRVYLGYHWPTDTLASACLSLVELGLVVAIDTWRTVETGTHVAPATAEGAETRPLPVRQPPAG
jgi:membrane-associated phospholipid phosphatase